MQPPGTEHRVVGAGQEHQWCCPPTRPASTPGEILQGDLLSGIEPLNCWLPLRQTFGHRFFCSPRASPAPEHKFKIHLESPICSGRGSLPMAANPLSLFCQFWKARLTAVELLNLYKKVQAPRTSFTCSVSSPLHSALLNLWVCTKLNYFWENFYILMITERF